MISQVEQFNKESDACTTMCLFRTLVTPLRHLIIGVHNSFSAEIRVYVRKGYPGIKGLFATSLLFAFTRNSGVVVFGT